MRQILLRLIRVYQALPREQFLFFGRGSCRFLPTCSEYCAEVIATHGTIKGTILCVRRLVSCNPLTKTSKKNGKSFLV